jgi:hypothetical protein
VATTGGAVTAVTVGPEHGLGFEGYGVSVPLSFSGSCTAAANASVNGDGSLGAVAIVAGGIGCSGTTTATVNGTGAAGVGGTLPARAVNLVAGRNVTVMGGNLLKGAGGYTVWNAGGSRSLGLQLGGGGTLAASMTSYPALVVSAGAGSGSVGNGNTGSANRFEGLGLAANAVLDGGLGNAFVQTSASGAGTVGLESARAGSNTVSADFVALGGGASSLPGLGAFTSLNDLFFSAEDLYSANGEAVAAGSLFGKDAAAPVTGSYVKAVGGAWDTSGGWVVRGVANGLILGAGFPAGSGTWFVAAKADVAAQQELRLTGVGSLAGCVYADQTVSLTPSWQVFRIAYNTVTGNSSCDSGTQGTAVSASGLAPSVAGGGSTNVETAWVAFVPATQQLVLANAPTAGNQAANKAYVDAQVASQIVNGGGSLPITGGTMTGALNAPVVNGTTDCGLAGSVSGCVAAVGASGGSALIPPGTVGTYTQGASVQATAQCVYALWLNEASPSQHERMIRWWQDEIEGTGRVPIISSEQKPEVLRFAQGTDADLRLEWQRFLIRMVANAFGLPPMLLGMEGDVNRATAGELADEAFRGAIEPLAKLIAEHITRDLFSKCIGWREFEFVFNDLDARDEMTELAIQTQLLAAGVLTVEEVRAMRGLGAEQRS